MLMMLLKNGDTREEEPGLTFENTEELSDEESNMVESLQDILENKMDVVLKGFKKIFAQGVEQESENILEGIRTASITGMNKLMYDLLWTKSRSQTK